MPLLGYTANPGKTAVIEFDEKRFEEEIRLLGLAGYELEQEFEGYDIDKIKTIVLTNVTPHRIDEVQALYEITYSDHKVTEADEDEYIFRLITPTSLKRGHELGRQLATLYRAEYHLYSRWSAQCKSIEKQKVLLQAHAVKPLIEFKHLADTINEGAEQLANTIDISEVVHKLKIQAKIDTVLNIVPGLGPPFNTAVNVLGSHQSAARFFNNEFNSGFHIDEGDGHEYIIAGISPTTPGTYEDPHGGYMRSGEKKDTKMTNFTVKVHYKLMKPSGENLFIVSLENDKGLVVNHIEWKNNSSEQLMTDYVMKYGNFQIMGGKDSVLKLHEMITSTAVPTIYGYAQYGYNHYKGNDIMIFPNGVFDLSQRKFFQKHDFLPYTFMGSHDGVMVDSSLTESEINKEQIAHFHALPMHHTLKDFMKITDQMYTDKSSLMLWMYACSMAGVSIFHQDPYVPSYYVSGVTGSGKSTFATFVARAFGVKTLYNIRESNVYPLKILLSSFKGLPVFLSEYRSEMRYGSEKKGLIQMCYDRSETAKGLKTGGILKYRMESQVFCEGEDTYDEGSIRTRSIKYTATKQSRKLGALPMEILNTNIEMIQSFYATYILSTDKETYLKNKADGQKLFARPGVEPRISDNIGFMYAGALTFAPDMKKEIIEMCETVLMDQVADYNENGESQKIIRLVAQYVNKKWANIYFEVGYLVIDWNDILEFKNRTKITDMQLSMDAYKGHLISLGWESDFYEVNAKDEFAHVEQKVVSGVRIKIGDCPRDLLTNSEIYAAYRQSKKAQV